MRPPTQPASASYPACRACRACRAASTVWYDAWAAAGDDSPGHTWTSNNPYVAPFAAAVFAQPVHHRRIDYIFVGSQFRWRPRIAVRSCQVVLQGDQTSAPSDHFGVMADLDLNGITLGQGQGLDTWADTAAMLWPK
jgi:endonuclease/exonuclease/phosphatase family metal-dependent hydrolase